MNNQKILYKTPSSRLGYMGDRKTHDRDYWVTPIEYIELARKSMGGIELDPASTPEANAMTVRAERFYTAEDNALVQSWHASSVWLNPPYGRDCLDFSRKYLQASDDGEFRQAIVLTNSATGTRAFRNWFAGSDAICFVNRRIQFLDPSGQRSQSSNNKEQLFFYKGRRVKTFARIFGQVGKVVSTNQL